MAVDISVDVINSYSEEFHQSCVHCAIDSVKGRILIANRSFKCGETIFYEPLLHGVAEAPGNEAFDALCEWVDKYEFSLSPIWYWCAINSIVTPRVREEALRRERQRPLNGVEGIGRKGKRRGRDDEPASSNVLACDGNSDSGEVSSDGPDEHTDVEEVVAGVAIPDKAVPLWKHLVEISEVTKMRLEMLHRPEPTTIGHEVSILLDKLELRELVTDEELENMIQIWVHNCFDFEDDPVGYATYFMPSFCSHSCLPNAVWRLEEGRFALGARLDIKPGDEITISYLGEDGLVEPAQQRQRTLHATKSFLCTCPRCIGPVDLSRGFSCPECAEGCVFLDPTAGTSRSPSGPVLSADPQYRHPPLLSKITTLKDTVNSTSFHCDPLDVIRVLNSYASSECDICQHKVTDHQLQALLTVEKKVVRFLRRVKSSEDSESESDDESSTNSQTNSESNPGSNQSNSRSSQSSQSNQSNQTNSECDGSPSVSSVDSSPKSCPKSSTKSSQNSQNGSSPIHNEFSTASTDAKPRDGERDEMNGNQPVLLGTLLTGHDGDKTDKENMRAEKEENEGREGEVEELERTVDQRMNEQHSEILEILEETPTKKQKTDSAPSDCEVLLKLDQKIRSVFKHHWAVLKLEQHMQQYFTSRSQIDMAVRRCTRRLLYSQRMFCAPSGVSAWCTEELADLLVLCQLHSSTTKLPPTLTLEQTNRILEDPSAFHLYSEAKRILRLLFGDEHEYVVDVSSKLATLEERLIASCQIHQLPTPPPIPS